MPIPKVIYFIAKPLPTAYERQEAALSPWPVVFRMPSLLVEPCDAVMGNVIPSTHSSLPSPKALLALKHEQWKAKTAPVQAPAVIEQPEVTEDQNHFHDEEE